MKPTRLSALLVALGAAGCGGKLDLGHGGPPGGGTGVHIENGVDVNPDGPPRTADGAVDETVPWGIVRTKQPVNFLAIDDSRLYWAGSEPVASCRLDACSKTVVSYGTANSDTSVDALAVRDSTVYWHAGKRIMSCPSSGCSGSPDVVTTGDDVGGGVLLVDETHVYWRDGKRTMRCVLLNCDATHEEFISTLTGAFALVHDGMNVYFYDASSDGIYAKAKTGTEPPRLIVSMSRAARLALTEDRIYWTRATSFGTISACPIAGCAGDAEVLVTGQRFPIGLVVDEHDVYFMNSGGGASASTVLACPISGCGDGPRVLASGLLTQGMDMVADSTHLYFPSSDESSLGDLIARVGK